MSNLFASYEPYVGRIGTKERVLVTEESHDKKHFVGHNRFYEQILVPKRNEFLGAIVDVEIVAVGKHYMMGSVITDESNALCKLLSRLPSDKSNIKSFWFYSCLFVLGSSLVFKYLSHNRFK